MADTISIHIRWPKALANEVRGIAARRHTTLSELTRQAVIDRYALHSDDPTPVKNDTDAIRAGSLTP